MKRNLHIFSILLNIFFSIIHKIKHLFSEIRESLKNEKTDFTEIRLGKALMLLAIPMVLEMVMESVFAVVDILFVSRLGADAVATVGITESMLTLVYALGFGLSMATTALISRRIGEKQTEKAGNIAFQAILTGVCISLVISLIGITYSGKLLQLMGANGVISGEMSGYTTIMLGFNMVIMLLFIINAIFRSAGDAAIAMRVLWLANLINLVLDPLLIYGWGPVPAFGVKGAAMATSTGRGIAVLYQFYLLFAGKGRIQLLWRHLSPDLRVIGQLVRLSLGTIGQNIIATSSWIGLMRIMSVFGSEVLAAYTIAIRIVIFCLLPSWGVSNAAATLVGQNLGAGKPDRAERSVWAAGKVNMILLGIIGTIFILFPDAFIRLFSHDPLIIIYGSGALRTVSFGFVFYGLGMVLMNAINGAGDTLTPTKFNLLCFWMIEIPLAWLLALHFDWAQKGVFLSIVIAESTLCLVALWWFRLGKWKLQTV
ncbi:MAG: MATE family efflux transporter [Bacteroidetes bacterium]|nr:MATE family efflux transporter [Bacteroidota bacterium]